MEEQKVSAKHVIQGRAKHIRKETGATVLNSEYYNTQGKIKNKDSISSGQ